MQSYKIFGVCWLAACLMAPTFGDGFGKTVSFHKGWGHSWPWGHKYNHGGYKVVPTVHSNVGHHGYFIPIGGHWGGYGDHIKYDLPYGEHDWGHGIW